MSVALRDDVAAIQKIAAVPTILDIVCRLTGMGFAVVSRVTEDDWVACSVLDKIAFGLEPGGKLKIETTICHEVRQMREPVVIDHVAQDKTYCGHPTPRMYGFQSYISMPIILPDGTFFGTLCAIDRHPAKVSAPEILGAFKLFAELIAFHFDSNSRLATSEAALKGERKTSRLREEFIAVLGHDLRNPLAAIKAGLRMLGNKPTKDRAAETIRLMQGSAVRMESLIDNVLDFARGPAGWRNRDREQDGRYRPGSRPGAERD